MAKLVFHGHFGLYLKTVEICTVSGAGRSYQLYVDRYYWGCFNRTSFGFVRHLTLNSVLTTDDLQIIEELIEGVEHLPQ